MNFEIIDNLFQVLVLFSAMAASAVTACKRKMAVTKIWPVRGKAEIFCSLQAAMAAL